MNACDEIRMSLGAHLLGALDPDEAVLVEAHLATCPECLAELDEISGLPALLGRVSEADIEHAASPPHSVLDRVIAASVRRRRVHRLMMGLAASLVAVVLGGTAWFSSKGQEASELTSVSAPSTRSAPASDSAAGTERRLNDGFGSALAATPGASTLIKDAPADPSPSVAPKASRSPAAVRAENGRVSADLKLIPGRGGTTVEISLGGVPEGTSCRVTAIATDGTRSPAGSWTIDGEAYHGGKAVFKGYTELPMDRIRSFDIRAAGGERLLWIRVA